MFEVFFWVLWAMQHTGVRKKDNNEKVPGYLLHYVRDYQVMFFTVILVARSP